MKDIKLADLTQYELATLLIGSITSALLISNEIKEDNDPWTPSEVVEAVVDYSCEVSNMILNDREEKT